MAKKPTYEQLKQKVKKLEKEAIKPKQAEEALEQKVTELNSFINNIPDMAWIKDTNSNFIAANKAFGDAVGMEPEYLVNHTCEICFGKEAAKKFKQDDRKVIKSRKQIVIEEDIVVEGKKVNLETIKSPIFNESGEVVGTVGVARDITERKQAEEALRRSEERYRVLFEGAAEGILVADIETKEFKYVNPAVCRMLGYSEEELKGMSVLDIHPKEALEHVISEFEAQARGEKTLASEIPFLRKDGTTIYADIKTTKLFIEGRACNVGFFTDITERKQTEEELQRNYDTQATINSALRLSLEDLPLDEILRRVLDLILSIPWLALESKGSIFLVEDDPNVLVMKAQNGLGEAVQKACARVPFGRCLCGRAALEQKTQFADSINDQHEISYEGMTPHGHYCVPILFSENVLGVINLYIRKGARYDQKVGEFLTMTANTLAGIIQRKRSEEELTGLYDELRLLNIELEQKVEERTQEVLTINEELARASQAKSEFLASMSHELRTPLNAVIGFSEVLQDKYFGELNEKQAEYINDIWESGKHLLALINDILDLSKVEAGKVELEPSEVNIKELVGHSPVMIREKCMKHGISLSLDIAQNLEDLKITADERRLKQIMFNLLSNAAKFTPDGGEIHITAQSTIINQQSSIQISIADTGIGIAPEDQENIFDPFYQVRGGMADKAPGTGLGLSITRRLVQMHGGGIWVESEGKDKGSRFTFVLPIDFAGLEEGVSEAKGGLPVIGIEKGKTLMMNHLNRVISLSKRHNKHFVLCCLHADMDNWKERAMEVKEAMEKEKRGYDPLGVDEDGNIYLILQEIDEEKATLACDRLRKKMEGVLEGQKVSCSMATFPEDGETSEALFRKVRQE